VVEEADETVFWLELLADTAVVPPEKVSLLLKEAKRTTSHLCSLFAHSNSKGQQSGLN
jgi:hypothetical protein